MSFNPKASKMYPIRLKNGLRYKSEIVAANRGRKLSEHINWLLNQSITNYEVEFGVIQFPKILKDE